MVPTWNVASRWDRIAELGPVRDAVVDASRHVTWPAFADRATRLAWHLRTHAMVVPGDRVAIALGNRAEYLEVLYAALKIGGVPLNVDLRHGPEQIHAVLDHSDAKVVVCSDDRAKAVRTAAGRIPKRWRPVLLVTGTEYERAIAGAPPPGEWESRLPDANDRVLIYTGGTTGTTTALIWRSEDLESAMRERSDADRSTFDEADSDLPEQVLGAPVLPVVSLTHTLGLFPAMAALTAGRTVVLVDKDPFDPIAVWDSVERERVAVLYPGVESSASQLLTALDASPARWDLDGLRTIDASEAPLSDAVRSGLARHLPAVRILRPRIRASTVGKRLRVVDELTGADVRPGSSAVGVVAVGGPVPLGYFKDLDKTASQFRSIDGTRYAISGAHATVDAAGIVHRADAGSDTVHRGSTPVSAPAVEFVLRRHPSVTECVVVGIPDRRSGERPVALIEAVDGHFLDEPELAAWCRTRLTPADTPVRFLFVDSLPASNLGAGSRDALRRLAIERLGTDAS